jgi:hypothetical protein
MAKRIYQLNESAFDVLTDEAIYWLGFMLADGCVLDYKRLPGIFKVQVNAVDIWHLIKFRTFLGSTHPIYWRKNTGFGTALTATLRIRSRKLALRLAELGVTPRKSKVAIPYPGFIHSPHYWRGVVDGDGWLCPSIHNKPVIGLCGSQSVVGGFRDYSISIATSCTSAVYPHSSIFKWYTSGIHAVPIITELYQSGGICLDRKLFRAQELLAC